MPLCLGGPPLCVLTLGGVRRASEHLALCKSANQESKRVSYSERVPSKKVHAASGHRRARSVSSRQKLGAKSQLETRRRRRFLHTNCSKEMRRKRTKANALKRPAAAAFIMRANERRTRESPDGYSKIGQVSLICIPNAIIAPRAAEFIFIRRALKYY